MSLYDSYTTMVSRKYYSGSPEEYRRLVKYYELNFGRYLPRNKDAKILDIGCGMGHFLNYMDRKGYKNAKGVDISEEQVEYCKKNVASQAIKIDNLIGYLSENKNHFDLIVMNDVIEHLAKNEIIDVLKSLRKALSDKGVFLIRTINCAGFFGSYFRYADFTHESSFSEDSLLFCLKMADFSEIEIKAEKQPAYGVLSMVRIIMLKFLHLLWRVKYYIAFGAKSPVCTGMLIAIARR